MLSYALAFIAFFSFLPRLGLSQIAVREYVANPEKEETITGTVFFLKLCGGIFSIILISLSVWLVKYEDTLVRLVVFLVALQFVFHSMDVIDFFFQSRVLSKYVVISRNVSFILTSLVRVFLIIYDYSVEYFACAILLESLATAFFLFIVYRKVNMSIRRWRYDHETAVLLIKDSWPLAISNVLIVIHMRIDQLMIDSYLSTSELGIYSVAVRLSETWYFIPQIIVFTLMPYFVKLRSDNPAYYLGRLNQLYSVMFWMSAIVGGAIFLWGRDLVVLLYGLEYQDSYSSLVFNIWSGVFVSQALVRGIWLINENMQRYRLYNNLISVGVNILLNILLIPLMGIAGAALASLFTQFLGMWVLSMAWKPLRDQTISMISAINPKYLFRSI